MAVWEIYVSRFRIFPSAVSHAEMDSVNIDRMKSFSFSSGWKSVMMLMIEFPNRGDDRKRNQ